MNYGNAKVAAGGTLVVTGLTFKQQIVYIIAAVLLVTALAVLVRRVWRPGKKLGEK